MNQITDPDDDAKQPIFYTVVLCILSFQPVVKSTYKFVKPCSLLLVISQRERERERNKETNQWWWNTTLTVGRGNCEQVVFYILQVILLWLRSYLIWVTCDHGPFLLAWIGLAVSQHVWVITCPAKRGMKLRMRSQTSTVKSLKLKNGYVHPTLDGWENYVSIVGLKLNYGSTKDPTVYPKKYAHGFVVLCFVVVMQSFIMNSHELFIHIHQGCFAGTGAIVRLPQCQWSKPDGYGKISQCITTTKHSKAKTVCIFLGIYCMSRLL